MGGSGGQLAPGRGLAQQVTGGHRQRNVGGLLDLSVAAPLGLGPHLRVDIRQGTRHFARPERLDPGRLHRLEDLARHRATGGVFRMRGRVVMPQPHRQRIGGAARLHDLVTGHAPADLRQPHRVARHARGIGGEGHVQLGLVRERARRLGQGLLEGIGGVVGFVHTGSISQRIIRSATG